MKRILSSDKIFNFLRKDFYSQDETSATLKVILLGELLLRNEGMALATLKSN
jgi:hypothetical protein